MIRISMCRSLALLGLGRRYIGCFFGDNYPTPRPNQLYQSLSDTGVALEHWSLLTYVLALRAGALGQPYAVTSSLSGTQSRTRQTTSAPSSTKRRVSQLPSSPVAPVTSVGRSCQNVELIAP